MILDAAGPWVEWHPLVFWAIATPLLVLLWFGFEAGLNWWNEAMTNYLSDGTLTAKDALRMDDRERYDQSDPIVRPYQGKTDDELAAIVTGSPSMAKHEAAKEMEIRHRIRDMKLDRYRFKNDISFLDELTPEQEAEALHD